MNGERSTRVLSAAPWQCDDLALPASIIRLLQRMVRRLRKRADFLVQIKKHEDNELLVWVSWREK